MSNWESEDISRAEIDEVLFNALRAVYQLERVKIKLFNITYEEIYILQCLKRNKHIRMGDLVAELKIPISTASRVVSRMEDKNLVKRKRDGSDRRNVLVSLCPAGRAKVKKVEDHTFSIIMKNIAQFTAEEVASFYTTARNLKNILLNDANTV